MKKVHPNNKLIKSILSMLVLGLFLLLAAGSMDVLMEEMLGFTSNHERIEPIGDRFLYYFGVDNSSDAPITMDGFMDDQGRWHGPVAIKLRDNFGSVKFVIYLFFDHGFMKGEYKLLTSSGSLRTQHYYYSDNRVEEDPDQKSAQVEASGFDRLNQRYTWLLHYLDAFGFGEEYVEHYMDTLEILLSEYSFEEDEFDDHYDETVGLLEETPFDSLIELNSVLAGIRGLELAKRLEIRMAVIDHCRSTGSSTYDIISDTYPGILAMLSEEEISHGDFHLFCNDLDDSLAVYGPLDMEDAFFIDSVDARLYRAIIAIYNSGEENVRKGSNLYPNEWIGSYRDLWQVCQDARPPKKQFSNSSTSPEIAEMVIYIILMEFLEGDMIKRSVREAYMKRSGIIVEPIVATQLKTVLSESSVSVEGYVIEDGGAEVSARGIVWSGFHNPTLEDQVESAGDGSGKYTVDLDGLIEGETYYARAFATNSTGTAYGNCISFAVSEASGVDLETPAEAGLLVYPNPTSSATTCSFQLEEAAQPELLVYDNNGRQVFRKDFGSLPAGRHRVIVDVSEFQEGMFHCELWANKSRLDTQKFLVVH